MTPGKRWWAAVLLAAAVSALGAEGLQITDLRVPAAVRNGSSAAVLDCEYSLRAEELRGEAGLVVKWYFNNGPSPVYQWIPGVRPQDLGILRGRLDLRHKATDHHATMHRALYIVRPTTELSGEYKCHVSTFEDEDFMTKKMVVYATEKKFELQQTKPDPDSVKVTCSAKGLYPEPKIALYKAGSGTKLGAPDVRVETMARRGAYDVSAIALLRDADLEAPTFFDCELKIPEVRYAVRKTIVYYPGIYVIPSGTSPCGRQPSPAVLLVPLLALLAAGLRDNLLLLRPTLNTC